MIDKFVNNTATRLVAQFPNELPPFGITRYSLKFIFTNVIPISLLLLIGVFTGNLSNVFISVLSFSILRMTSGGYHSDYPELCLIYSSVLILSIAEFGGLIGGFEWICSGIAFILVTVYAPSNIENQTKILKKYFKYLKYISMLTVLIGFLIQNPVVSLAMLAQSLLLVRLKGGEVK
ncbi:accessory gene regulator B family protein [Paenibacillus xylanexedens]|uniref:accessory gene regulator B family protein n=1 Tax=Paenibacillus xylanexedens TaxID=528191 RepID=UPI000F51DD51|nr:accessory gene regulator B family protein [Paenibacillus xylanexedens]